MEIHNSSGSTAITSSFQLDAPNSLSLLDLDTTLTHAVHIIEYEDKVFEVEVLVDFLPELPSFPHGIKLSVDSKKVICIPFK